jgi:hypothetical protein
LMLTVSTPCTVPNRGSVAGCRFTGLRSRTPPRPGKDCVVSFPRFPHEAAILARVVARQSQTVTKSAPFYHPSPVTGVGETHRLGPLHNLALLHRRRKSRHSDLALVNHVHTKRRHATSDGGRAPGLGHGGAMRNCSSRGAERGQEAKAGRERSAGRNHGGRHQRGEEPHCTEDFSASASWAESGMQEGNFVSPDPEPEPVLADSLGGQSLFKSTLVQNPKNLFGILTGCDLSTLGSRRN